MLHVSFTGNATVSFFSGQFLRFYIESPSLEKVGKHIGYVCTCVRSRVRVCFVQAMIFILNVCIPL